jgi:hypothetical protein
LPAPTIENRHRSFPVDEGFGRSEVSVVEAGVSDDPRFMR